VRGGGERDGPRHATRHEAGHAGWACCEERVLNVDSSRMQKKGRFPGGPLAEQRDN
jgi:hypothetical protein